MDPEQRRAAKGRDAAATAELFAAALSHHRAGRLDEAERLYRQICAVDPPQADAYFNLGSVLAKQKRSAEAAACYRKVVALRPGFAEAHYALGTVCLEQSRSAEAAAAFERALELKPNYPEAHFNLGFLLTQEQRLPEAVARYQRTLALRPDFVEAHNALGVVLLTQGETAAAIACFERALALRPGFAKAHCNLGRAFEQQGRLEDAMGEFARALALAPDLAEAHYNVGTVHAAQGRLDTALASFERALASKPDFVDALNSHGVVLRDLKRPADALASFEAALEINPDFADGLSNRGAALRDLQRSAEALVALEAALAIRPDHADAHYNRGIALCDLERPSEALASFDAALAIRPAHADAHYNRGAALRDLTRLAEAIASFEQALALNPDHRYAFCAAADAALAACDWTKTSALAGALEDHAVKRRSIVSPFTLLGYGSGSALLLESARGAIADKIGSVTPLARSGTTGGRDRLRIAYLSADFRQHAVACLIAGLIEGHDRRRFDIFGISLGPDDGSDMRARLAAAFDQFHDVRSKSDLDVASLLRTLEVDIAVDLMGHTRGARPGILAHRPAPIQANYLGYPGTTGADFIDYVMADKIVLPFEQQPFYSERIVHLPHCYQVNDSNRMASERIPTRLEAGLPQEAFVFCCFNNNYKIAPPVFDVWMRLLRAVDGSVLWLLHDNDDAQANLRAAASARGVDPARLVFAGRLDPAEHLARHRVADLFLDTLPYNAHTTGSDALWSALPLLTCRGEGFAAQVGASLLYAAGLPELITHDLPAYEAMALRLAGDQSLLHGFRQRLAQNRSSCALFDTDRSRRHIEAAYATMWDLYRRGESPGSFSVEP